MITEFISEVKNALDRIDPKDIEKMSDILASLRSQHGRLFLIGSGGGAGHASHACCDFRKLCGIESYHAYDNVTELTARTNDDGWGNTIIGYLFASNFGDKDCLFVFSVGGGGGGVSSNLHHAILYAHDLGAKIIGIVGREECTLVKYADASVVIKSSIMTPIVEGLQSVIAHLLCTKLAVNKTVW